MRWCGRDAGNGRAPAGRLRWPAMLLAGLLAGVHFSRFVVRLQFFRELRKRQAESGGAHPFRLLAEEFVTQDVELPTEERVFAFGAAEGVL